MNRDMFVSLIFATLEHYTAQVYVKLPTGELALVRGVTSVNGDIIIETTLDVREELNGGITD